MTDHPKPEAHARIGRPRTAQSMGIDRKCSICGLTMPLEDFASSKNKPFGKDYRCKKCAAMRARLRNTENERRCRARYEAAHSASRKARDRADKKSPKGLARNRLRGAVYRGTIVKPSNCNACGLATPVHLLHGHHKDYTRPTDVTWLCPKCHGKEHRKYE